MVHPKQMWITGLNCYQQQMEEEWSCLLIGSKGALAHSSVTYSTAPAALRAGRVLSSKRFSVCLSILWIEGGHTPEPVRVFRLRVTQNAPLSFDKVHLSFVLLSG